MSGPQTIGATVSLGSLVEGAEYDPITGLWTFVNGAQMSQGPQGPQGYQGYQGVQGANGLQGAQGHQGVPGAQGAQGGAGGQGPQGFQGTQGHQGTQGNQGFQGTQGFQGVQGAQGFQGATGAGTQGAQGPQGVQGSTGSQGPQGFQGTQGVQGTQGFQGNQGAQGAQGAQGSTGSQGPQGFQGTQGNQGNQGTQGASAAPLTTVSGNLTSNVILTKNATVTVFTTPSLAVGTWLFNVCIVNQTNQSSSVGSIDIETVAGTATVTFSGAYSGNGDNAGILGVGTPWNTNLTFLATVTSPGTILFKATNSATDFNGAALAVTQTQGYQYCSGYTGVKVA